MLSCLAQWLFLLHTPVTPSRMPRQRGLRRSDILPSAQEKVIDYHYSIIACRFLLVPCKERSTCKAQESGQESHLTIIGTDPNSSKPSKMSKKTTRLVRRNDKEPSLATRPLGGAAAMQRTLAQLSNCHLTRVSRAIKSDTFDGCAAILSTKVKFDPSLHRPVRVIWANFCYLL